MFNPKRQVRECTNQVLEFDVEDRRINILKCKGISIGVRKNHSAACFKGSMIVYGGQSENGMMLQEMIVFHMDSHEWVKVALKEKNQMPCFVQGGVCSVVPKNGQMKDGLAVRKVSARWSDVFRATRFRRASTTLEAGATTAS